MKKVLSIVLIFIFLLGLTGCNSKEKIPPVNDVSGMENEEVEEALTDQDVTDHKEDFSFSLVWNCYGTSSYDSQTGKLVKTTNATNPEDYITYYQLTDEDKEYIYNLIASLDVKSYPDIYDPKNGGSAPPMTLILTVRENGEVKTITAEDISVSFVSADEKGQKFLSVCEEICNRLTATDEWQALPEYEYLYE